MTEIDLPELEKWKHENRPFLLVDVREREEHVHFNIGGTLAPLSKLREYREIFDTDRPIVLYCKRGIRSQLAIQRLERWGEQRDFYNLRGGILTLLNSHGQF